MSDLGKKIGWRVWYWEGEPLEDSVPDHETFDVKGRALEFAKRIKKQHRLGYVVKVEMQKDDNGDDIWVEVEEHEQ